MASPYSVFSSSRLHGHRGGVCCLEMDAEGHRLLSGSEDKTVRLWDLKTSKVAKCMAGFSGAVEVLRLGPDGHVLFAACSDAIYSFDLRAEGLLCRTPLSQVALSDDEISHIAVNTKGDLLAAAMDSGVVNLLPLRAGVFEDVRPKRLSRVHSSIVSCVNFRRNNPRELLSVGFDYAACLWDVDRGRPKASTSCQALQAQAQTQAQAQALALAQTQADANSTVVASADADASAEVIGEDGEGGCLSSETHMLNPPFIMGADFLCHSRLVALALGNGLVRLLNKDLTLNSSIYAHNCMISALACDNWHIVTGGTDC
eukprot:CAMPEP_0173294054 /NCGR_PEP_ID=MMETSP1143-20121109/13657_1 /TAXON_ID=483371 /ORGANISM="non described non described, Strain CCMP2298" /LENGTH=314 /DNA_ID=CAMNT_0014233683 /DNA_START=32 /DNA_END=973 /DNA_ORIENTATION=+